MSGNRKTAYLLLAILGTPAFLLEQQHAANQRQLEQLRQEGEAQARRHGEEQAAMRAASERTQGQFRESAGAARD